MLKFQAYHLQNIDFGSSIWNIDLTINFKLNNALSKSKPLVQEDRIRSSNPDFKFKPPLTDLINLYENEKIALSKKSNPVFLHFTADRSARRALNSFGDIHKSSIDENKLDITYKILYDLIYFTFLLNALSLDGWHAIDFTYPYNPFVRCSYEPSRQYRFEAKLCFHFNDIIFDYLTGSIITDDMMKHIWHMTDACYSQSRHSVWQIFYFKFNV